MGNFANFKKSYKINEKSYNNFDNFIAVVIRKKKEIWNSEKIGVSGTLNLSQIDQLGNWCLKG